MLLINYEHYEHFNQLVINYWEAKEDMVCMCEKWYHYMQPGWCQPVRQEFMENECEALPGAAYPGVRDNCSTINTKTGYDDDDDSRHALWGRT